MTLVDESEQSFVVASAFRADSDSSGNPGKSLAERFVQRGGARKGNSTGFHHGHEHACKTRPFAGAECRGNPGPPRILVGEFGFHDIMIFFRLHGVDTRYFKSNSVVLAAIVTAIATGETINAENAHPVVPGFERFHSGTDLRPPSLADGGRLLIHELNCVACHDGATGLTGPIPVNRAPVLVDAGDRLKPDWLRKFLADPHAALPGTRMPGLMDGLTGDERNRRVEALVHYLASLHGDTSEPLVGNPDSASGILLYNQIGCAACHAPMTASGALSPFPNESSAPIADPNEKFMDGIAFARFLLDPVAWRPGGRMPAMNLSRDEALSIASAFGLTVNTGIEGIRSPDDESLIEAGLLDDLMPGVVRERFSGNWNQLPEFSRLAPADSEIVDRIEVGDMAGKDRFGLRFRGYIRVETAGPHRFYTRSDDGSQLFIGSVPVVNNDGVHGAAEKSGVIELESGWHAFTVTFFEQAGGEELAVHWEGPGFSKRILEGDPIRCLPQGSFPSGGRLIAEAGFQPDPALVRLGRQHFTDMACVACHGNPETPTTDATRSRRAKPMAGLNPAAPRGCLAEDPGPGVPDFALSPGQTAAIAAALRSPARPESRSESESIHQTMVSLNCYACHERDGQGGPTAARESYFTSTGDDLGSEGQIPPGLTGAGVKLTQAWLGHVLGTGAKIRPYMTTRMPAFPMANVKDLPGLFKTADLFSAKPTPPPPELTRSEVMRFGRQLTGIDGMSCITCHRFNGENALGIQVMDLRHVAGRLERAWFGRYLVDPNGLRPGTRMPSFWPEGRSVRADILDGDTEAQIEALWRYFKAMPDVPKPKGLGRNEIVLTPANNEPVIYRNFIAGAGPRAIGVGYPEQVNLAWDANHLRPAAIWKGDFIDASKHWIGRGPGFQGPYGYSVIELPDGPTLATLKDAGAGWPEADPTEKMDPGRFLGFRLGEDRRPTFLFRFGSVRVEDEFEPITTDNRVSFRRTLRLSNESGEIDSLYYLAAAGSAIAETGANVFVVDDRYEVRLSTSSRVKPRLRQSGRRTELLLPIRIGNKDITVKQEYHWE